MCFGETQHEAGDAKMNNSIQDKSELIAELRLAFFESSYATVEMFAKYSGVWDPELNAHKYIDWNYEKKAFLNEQITRDEAARETYITNLSERVAMTSQMIDFLQEKIKKLKQDPDLNLREIHIIVQSIQKLADVQDKSMTILKIDGAKSEAFNKNKRTVLDIILKRNNNNTYGKL